VKGGEEPSRRTVSRMHVAIIPHAIESMMVSAAGGLLGYGAEGSVGVVVSIVVLGFVSGERGRASGRGFVAILFVWLVEWPRNGRTRLFLFG
jgi:hypothetical protein